MNNLFDILMSTLSLLSITIFNVVASKPESLKNNPSKPEQVIKPILLIIAIR